MVIMRILSLDVSPSTTVLSAPVYLDQSSEYRLSVGQICLFAYFLVLCFVVI